MSTACKWFDVCVCARVHACNVRVGATMCRCMCACVSSYVCVCVHVCVCVGACVYGSGPGL